MIDPDSNIRNPQINVKGSCRWTGKQGGKKPLADNFKDSQIAAYFSKWCLTNKSVSMGENYFLIAITTARICTAVSDKEIKYKTDLSNMLLLFSSLFSFCFRENALPTYIYYFQNGYQKQVQIMLVSILFLP